MSLKRPSSTKPPHEGLIFFTDRDLGNAVPDALERAGVAVRRHDLVFPDPRTSDPTWLRHVGREGWVALSHNKKIQRVQSERDMAMKEGVALFLLIGKLTHAQLAANLIVTLPKIITFRRTHEPPFTARVYRPTVLADLGKKPGRVELWMTKESWERKLALEAKRRR